MRHIIATCLVAVIITVGVSADAWKFHGADGTAQEILWCYHSTGQYDSTDLANVGTDQEITQKV